MKLYFVGNKNSEKNNRWFAIASTPDAAQEVLEKKWRAKGCDRVVEKSVDMRQRKGAK